MTDFYFTFGVGSPLANYYVRITAVDETAARCLMAALFSGHWCGCYTNFTPKHGEQELTRVNRQASVRLGTNYAELDREIYNIAFTSGKVKLSQDARIFLASPDFVLATVLNLWHHYYMVNTNRRESRKQHQARMEALKAEARRIVATGQCPNCGSPLVYNNALPGWWQCAGYASDDFRKPEHRHLPKCHFQTFTE